MARSYEDVKRDYNDVWEKSYAISDRWDRRCIRLNIFLNIIYVFAIVGFIMGGYKVGEIIVSFIAIDSFLFFVTAIVCNSRAHREQKADNLPEREREIALELDRHPLEISRELVAREFNLKDAASVVSEFSKSTQLYHYMKCLYFTNGKQNEVIVAYNRNNHSATIANSLPSI